MKDKIIKNCLMNLVLTMIFVLLNDWALRNRFEETFVFLAIGFGVTVIIGNVIFVYMSGNE